MRAPCLVVCGLVAVIACGKVNSDSVDGQGPGDGPGDGSGSSSGANQVQGLVNGKAFDAKDAVSAQFPQTNGFGFDGPATFVQISDYAGACALAARNTAPPGSLILDLAVAIDDAHGKATAPTGPGTFTVYPPSQPLPPSANVAQVYYGSGCLKSVAYSGISGTITVSTVNPDGSLAGTFDVVISCASFSSCAGPDAHITGTFSSAACAALNVNTTQTCS